MTEETRTVTRTVYVSEDHEIFDTPEECMEHERKIRSVKSLFDKIPSFRCTPEFIPNDIVLAWYYVSSADEVETIEIADEIKSLRSQVDEHKSPVTYPCWICVCTYDDSCYDPDFLGTSDEFIAKLDEYKAELTKRMEESEHEKQIPKA